LELFGFASYIIATFSFIIFGLLLLAANNNTLAGRLILMSVFFTMLSFAVASFQLQEHFSLKFVLFFETLKHLFWLLLIISSRENVSSYRDLLINPKCRTSIYLGLSISLVTWVTVFYFESASKSLFILFLMFNLWGLVALEQLFRNANKKGRWALWPLVIALGVMYVLDFIIFAQASMLNQLNFDLWYLRAVPAILAFPLLLVSTRRMKDWSVNVFVSRGVVFYSSMLMIAGLYLLIMAGAGYLINFVGGEWGQLLSIVFLILGGVVLGVLLITESLRKKVKVFITKHFFANKYEYREEWLNLIEKIETTSAESHYQMATQIMMSKLKVNGGALVKKITGHQFKVLYCEGMELNEDTSNLLVEFGRFSQSQGWLIDIQEYARSPSLYQGLTIDIDKCLSKKISIVIPIFIGKGFYGMFIFSNSKGSNQLNWEDRDLLFAISKQLGNFISLHEANDKLAESKQFDAFNRMSAFLVHDLKNIQAQLSLVTSNAQKHRDNPCFIDDVFETVESATTRLDKVLSQLRNKQAVQSNTQIVELSSLITGVIKQRNIILPKVEYEADDKVEMQLDGETFYSILNHLIQNAQEATDEQGWVRVTLSVNNDKVKISIADNGHGMSQDFINKRLFKPFDTTKGNAGMGIGVYEAKQFIESIAGLIEVDSIEGQGTKFTITLPINPVFDEVK